MIFLSFVDKSNKKKLLDYFFLSCTDFSIIYPNDDLKGHYNAENPLLNGKKEVLALEGIKILPWEGMDDSIVISGKLSDAAKVFFYNSLATRGLWNFSLWRGNEEVFAVSDFDNGILFLSDDEIENMEELKIITSLKEK